MKLFELVNPIEYHNILNPKLWDNDRLRSEVRGALLRISEDFIKFVDIPFKVLDIVIAGGNANYNYTEQSDIDVHLVVDRDGFGIPRDFIDQFLQDKKILWTMTHPDIKIYGYPLEDLCPCWSFRLYRATPYEGDEGHRWRACRGL